MKEIKKYFTKLLLLPVFVLVFFGSTYAQVNAGNGNLICGDFWHSFLTPACPSHTGRAATATAGAEQIAIGGYIDKTWSNPKGQYPNAWPWTDKWAPYLHFFLYDPDTTICPKTMSVANGGKANPVFYTEGANGAAYSHYFTANFKTTLPGGADPTRVYQRIPQWVDPVKQQHMIYEAGWVTNVGLDISIRAHAFAAPNWNNFNDFVLLEVAFKNTGVVDINFDGTPEFTNHKIVGLAVCYYENNMAPMQGTDVTGIRNQQLGTNPARDCGYLGEYDQNNSPWNFNFDFSGCSTQLNASLTNPIIPPAGGFDMGVAPWTYKFYTDIWTGYSWIGARKGGLTADPSTSSIINAEKMLMWGTPAIGTGAQRGWFTTSGHDYGSWNGVTAGAPRHSFLESIGTYMTSGGKDGADESQQNYAPNPNFFTSGKVEQIETWVPKKTSGFVDADRPNGDYKYLSLSNANPAQAFYQITENGYEDVNKPYTPNNSAGHPAWGFMGTRGYVDFQNFDFATFSGIGPFSLDVNESMTVTLLIGGGYRLEGLQKTIRAGRYAFENSFQIPSTPPLPAIHVIATTTPSIQIKWDAAAEKDANFAGYKVWRSSQFMNYTYLDGGMRLIDKYQEQTVPGAAKTNQLKPINPRFDGFYTISHSSYRGRYPGYYWGTWELLANIPKASLSTVIDGNPYTWPVITPATPNTSWPAPHPNDGKTTKYIYDDKTASIGGSYWYYVSAYGSGTYTGPDGETTTTIETHSTNRNGSTGFWEGTFPYAVNNANYPKTTDATERIGATLNLYSPTVSPSDLIAGVKKIGVRPNPYKRAALQDNFLQPMDHKLLFYNLPQVCKITIVDVAGQVIQVIHFSTTATTGGSVFWNMFSKDGEEVASGLYIYYVEYTGGTQTGKFAILR
jgi:hypothetical protein